jgi:hypothetical protein
METELDMLTSSESEIWLVVGELEGIRACVIGDGFAINQLDGYPSMLL